MLDTTPASCLLPPFASLLVDSRSKRPLRCSVVDHRILCTALFFPTMKLFLPLLLLPGTAAFAGVQQHHQVRERLAPAMMHHQSAQRAGPQLWAIQNRDSDGIEDDERFAPQLPSPSSSLRKVLPTVSASVLTWVASAQVAMADSPDWGLFEGRTLSLLHPLMMGSLLLYTIYTGLLGFQWRRQRTIGDEIKALQKSLPDLQGAASVKDAIAAAKAAEEPQASRIAALESAVPVEQQIKELQQERKSLVEAGPRDRHYSQGALLAFLGTAFAIEVRSSCRGGDEIHSNFHSYRVVTYVFATAGSAEYIRQGGKAVSRSSLVRWCESRCRLGVGSGVRPGDAEGE